MVYYVEESFGFGNIGHRGAVVCKADAAVFVHDAHHRHTAEFKNVDLLTIEESNAMLGIGNADEGQVFVAPILLKGGFCIRTNGEDDRAALGKLFVIVTEARQRRAAIRSHEAAQEVEQDGLVAQFGEADAASVEIVNFKIRCEFAWSEEFHFMSSFAFFQISLNIFTVSLPVRVFCWLG